MSLALAIGVGCRRGWPATAIAALVVRATVGFDRSGARLYTHAAKHDEATLHEASEILGLPLVFLSREVLEAVLPHVAHRSARVEAALGVGSVAEAAALSGAGPGSRLVVPRMADGGATCAVAVLSTAA